MTRHVRNRGLAQAIAAHAATLPAGTVLDPERLADKLYNRFPAVDEKAVTSSLGRLSRDPGTVVERFGHGRYRVEVTHEPIARVVTGRANGHQPVLLPTEPEEELVMLRYLATDAEGRRIMQDVDAKTVYRLEALS